LTGRKATSGNVTILAPSQEEKRERRKGMKKQCLSDL
jgi:hypothetical protein